MNQQDPFIGRDAKCYGLLGIQFCHFLNNFYHKLGQSHSLSFPNWLKNDVHAKLVHRCFSPLLITATEKQPGCLSRSDCLDYVHSENGL